MKLMRMWLDKHSNMRSYFVTVYDHIKKINQWTDNQLFQDWITCLLLIKEFSFKYDMWISWFMKKIKNSTHYHNVLKFEELETVLTAEKAQMNSDSVIEKVNIMWALKERFNQQERNHNNQDDKFTNDNDQSNSQSNQNSEQNQHSAVSHDKNCEKYNWFFNNWSNNQFSNNQFNNVSSITDSDKWSSQNTEKFMMTRILSINATESEESTEFVKILNQTAQFINKSTE